MSESGVLYLIHHKTGERFGPLAGEKGDVAFPPQVRGWGEVLDCRHKPYTEKSIEELKHYAYHVRKDFLLIDNHHVSFRIKGSA